MKTSFALLALTAASLFALVTPAFAYEEDTHFQMTYVICRSVGFTTDEAMIVAAADQGMDDSAGTSPMGVTAERIKSQWMWHALDLGGNMGAKGILARRDQLFQAALAETTVSNKLWRLGIFFHFQQDTWSHRHHYVDANFAPNHLSRDNYTTYNTPFGHSYAGHEPDRPPYDPVAALMGLEDGIVYAAAFLKQGLGRDPNPAFVNYKPQGGSVDTAWPGDGWYFHQISLSGATPKDPRSYLISLIRAQIDTYTATDPDPTTKNQRALEADLDAMRPALEKVCKQFEALRAGPGNRNLTITIPTTAQKVAQGFTGMTNSMLAGKLPETHLLLGVGTDGNLFTKTTLISLWITVSNSGYVRSINYLPDGTLLGAGNDGFLWTKANLTANWKRITNRDAIIWVTMMKDGTILGVGTDKNMWTKADLNADWKVVTNSGYVVSVDIMRDGTLLGVGTDGSLFTKADLTADWIQVENKANLIGVRILRDGTILGIKNDNLLYTRKTLKDSWVLIPDSGFVVECH